VEAYREVGAPGQPAFQGSWANENPTFETTAAFYKDTFGVIWLKGIVTGGTTDIFVLPEGYRPAQINCISTNRSSAAAYVCIDTDGLVHQAGGGTTGGLLLDGLTFRANAG
jgi:hypothetical protein